MACTGTVAGRFNFTKAEGLGGDAVCFTGTVTSAKCPAGCAGIVQHATTCKGGVPDMWTEYGQTSAQRDPCTNIAGSSVFKVKWSKHEGVKLGCFAIAGLGSIHYALPTTTTKGAYDARFTNPCYDSSLQVSGAAP